MQAAKGDRGIGERARAGHCPDFGTGGRALAAQRHLAPAVHWKGAMRFRTGIALLLLGLLAVLAYGPSLTTPLMEDDSPNLSQTLGPSHYLDIHFHIYD